MAPLTFGVEFEFLVATLDTQSAYLAPEDGRPIHYHENHLTIGQLECAVKTAIAQKLRDAGLQAHSDWSTAADDRGVENIKSWEVSDDASLEPTFPNDFWYWIPIEVKSPVYRFTPENLAAVKLAIQVITDNFRFDINHTCGLHVHVGNGTRGFTLPHLKNLMSFLWVMEPELKTLHPPHRHDNLFCGSLRRYSILGDHNPTVSQALDFISQAQNVNSLVRAMARGSVRDAGKIVLELAYNISNQKRDPWLERIKRTVEFRGHAATLDPERVLAWIKTVVGITEVTRDTSLDEMSTFLGNFVALEGHRQIPKNVDVVNLLRQVGLEDPAAFYEQRFRSNGSNHEVD